MYVHRNSYFCHEKFKKQIFRNKETSCKLIEESEETIDSRCKIVTIIFWKSNKSKNIVYLKIKFLNF